MQTIRNIEIWLLLSVLALVLPANQRVRGFQSDTPSFSESVSHDEAQRESFPKCAKPEDTICLNSQCVHTADMVLSKMKQEVEPCNNFYEFACGKLIEEAEIPEDEDIIDIFSTTKHTLQEQLKIILREERLETDPSHLKLPNALYKACMNTTLIESLGAKPMEEIADHLGGWPVVVGDSWDINNTWSWQETVQKFKLLGFSANFLFSLGLYRDLKNYTKYIVMLSEPELALNREYLVKGFTESEVSAYYDYMVDVAVLFGAEGEAARNELKGAVQFEIDLAKITTSKEKVQNISDYINYQTIQRVQHNYPYFQWKDYISSHSPKGLFVDENEEINVMSVKFFNNLDVLLKQFHKRDIANYLMWRIHAYAVPYLSKAFRMRQLKYYTAMTGITEEIDRSKHCTEIVRESFVSLPLGFLYINKFFSNESKTAAVEIFNNVREAFEVVLNETNWMDEKTKSEAKRKLNNIQTYIGYVDELRDSNKLKKIYDGVEIEPTKYFHTILKLERHRIVFNFNKLRMTVNEAQWIEYMDVTHVNAHYVRNHNSINFPAGILQGYIFNGERPQYMNYGALGCGIAHEITHGFDNIGRQFDLNGNVGNWWQLNTQDSFLKKAQCIIDQYGNFTDTKIGLHINGINTQGENIADNGGFKFSYMAYSKWLAKNQEELKLPGLQNYTFKQMFWISAAQVWCAKFRTTKLKDYIVTNAHSPNEFRVLGPLGNNKDFSRDFQCPQGAPMNPVKKCEVW